MKKTLQIVTSMAVGISLAACGASANGGTAPSGVYPLSDNVLQFAVGTANYAGVTALNVVVTYRQPSNGYHPGDSGTLLSSPVLTLPAALAGPAGGVASYDPLSDVLYGPATGEIGNDAVTSSSQAPETKTITSFGQSGGVFSLGIEPWNSQGSATVANNAESPADDGTPFQVAPYPVPLYDAANDTGAPDANSFVPWGGPPAFVVTGSGGDSIVGNSTDYPAGDAGIGEGIDVFEGVAPVAGGAYTMTVNIPTTSGTVTESSTYTLPAALTTIPTPVAAPFAEDGNGGGTVALTMPAGATEAFVQITDYGAPGAAATPIYYTLEATASGTVTLPDKIGPGGAESTTPGDDIVTQVVAMDYPLYEMNPLNSASNPKPTILGGNGEDDIAVSAATCEVSGAACPAGTLPLLKKRAFEVYQHRYIR